MRIEYSKAHSDQQRCLVSIGLIEVLTQSHLNISLQIAMMNAQSSHAERVHAHAMPAGSRTADQAYPVHNETTNEAELRRLVCQAQSCGERTREAGLLWGRAGELYAASHFGVRLCRPCTQGHDGRLGHDLVEIKTITPRKRKLRVRAKRTGNFNFLLIVRVLADHRFEARLVRRTRLRVGKGAAHIVLSWNRACALAEPV